ncbi:flagellar hook protein FlgE [Scandinavium goeteborgense]|uniref:Flagellar hook protein FlgE n=1 Tax=Scandinavium goeteborgense TaxID=1851514 RepID=A0A4R6EKU2_SCAGO|nr:flagellar hook protein FlgE [Scandinavium goeteborgense]TDN59448.1 flagellar hook protein FlgE [Scandinavium goeteborgense]
MSFSQGLSGLNAAAAALDVVGNNIANSQTYGFKVGSIAFADVFAGTTGLGVQVAGVNQNFADGGLAGTNRNLDIGLQGRGFFRMVNEGGSVFYGRNGQFDLDVNGNVYNKTNGLFLTGYQATGTPPVISPGAPIGPIQIPTGDMPPAASTSGSLTGNLQADDTNIITDAFDYTDDKTYNYTSQVEATDSLGNKHTIKLYFVQTAAGEWKAYARDETSPAAAPDDIAELPLTFDPEGKMTGPSDITVKGAAFNGSNALSVDLDLSAITKYQGDSSMKLKEIDGQAPGKYQTFVIGDNGEVIATYSNGKRQTVAQIALADFANSGGLAAEGNNVWSETPQSGQPFFGTSGTGSFGTVSGGMLEQSNVDLGQEMVNMIVYQRNYQSNSQTIKTQSELLQTLVNLR